MLYKEALLLKKGGKLTDLAGAVERTAKYPYLSIAEQTQVDNASRLGSTGAGVLAGGMLGLILGAAHGASSDKDKMRKAIKHGIYGSLIGGAVGGAGGFGVSYPAAELIKGMLNDEKKTTADWTRMLRR